MTDAWKQLEGQVVDDEFPLQQCLAANERSAVFLTQHGESQPQRAAIKLLLADPATADLQLSRWRLAEQLAHPNLLRVFDFGRCNLNGTSFLYVVMEYAEEDLSQILPQRALAPTEVREMLDPLLDVIVYLHGKGLVHGHIQPSNVLAVGDQLKLSSDTLSSIAEPRASITRPSPYTAPEVATSGVSPAGDVWSLSATLLEALTQQPPVIPATPDSSILIPDTLPQPILDIARHTLLREPKHRWTPAVIAGRLNPVAAAAAAGLAASSTAGSPLAVPLSSVPAVPAAKLQSSRFDSPSSKNRSPRQQDSPSTKETLVLPGYSIPLAVAALVVIAIIALPKLLSHRPEASSSASRAASQPSAPVKSAAQPAHRDVSPPAKTVAPIPQKIAPEKKPSPSVEPATSTAALRPSSAQAPSAAPAALRTNVNPPPVSSKPSSASSPQGEALEQVLPDISEKARGSIQGKVRVTIRVHVEPAGTVSQAELDAPGPSRYFADLAQQAARRWAFTAPEVNGHSVASDWLIRFEFSSSGTQAFPKQVTP